MEPLHIMTRAQKTCQTFYKLHFHKSNIMAWFIFLIKYIYLPLFPSFLPILSNSSSVISKLIYPHPLNLFLNMWSPPPSPHFRALTEPCLILVMPVTTCHNDGFANGPTASLLSSFLEAGLAEAWVWVYVLSCVPSINLT